MRISKSATVFDQVETTGSDRLAQNILIDKCRVYTISKGSHSFGPNSGLLFIDGVRGPRSLINVPTYEAESVMTNDETKRNKTRRIDPDWTHVTTFKHPG